MIYNSFTTPSCVAEKASKTEKEKQEQRDVQAKQRRYILPDIHVPLAPPDDHIPEHYTHPPAASAPQRPPHQGYHQRLTRILRNGAGDSEIQNAIQKTGAKSTQKNSNVLATTNTSRLTSVDTSVKLPQIDETTRANSWSGGEKKTIYKGLQLRKNAAITKLSSSQGTYRKRSGRGSKARKTKKGEDYNIGLLDL